MNMALELFRFLHCNIMNFCILQMQADHLSFINIYVFSKSKMTSVRYWQDMHGSVLGSHQSIRVWWQIALVY